MTNRSYDQNIVKKISTQTNIKNVIKILFWTTVLYFIEETLFLLFCNRKTTYLNTPRPAGGCVSHLTSYFRITTRCSECILFIRQGVPILTELCSFTNPSDTNTTYAAQSENYPFCSLLVFKAVTSRWLFNEICTSPFILLSYITLTVPKEYTSFPLLHWKVYSWKLPW